MPVRALTPEEEKAISPLGGGGSGGVRVLTPEEEGNIVPADDAGSAFSRSALGEATRMGALGAGAVMGGKIGLAAGAPLGPAGMAGLGALGTVLGGGAGLVGGDALVDRLSEIRGPLSGRPLAIKDINELPENLRSFAVGGQVVGGTIPFLGIPWAVSSRLPIAPVVNRADKAFNAVNRWLNGVADTAIRAPKSFLAGEAVATSGAATGAGIMEATFPGEAGPRVAGEVVGGLFNPTRIVYGSARGTIKSLRQFVLSYTKEGRNIEAANNIAKLLEATGESPEEIARVLREEGLPGTNLTAAQKSVSPGLMALERKLVSDSQKFGSEVGQQTEASFQALRGLMTSLAETGDPAMLVAAAKVRENYIKTLLTARARGAASVAEEAAGKITKDTPAAQAGLSRTLDDALDTALTESRGIERSLWAKVDLDGPATADGILGEMGALRNELTKEEVDNLPHVLTGFVKRVAGDADGGPAQIDINEIKRFRSAMLRNMQTARANREFDNARIFGRMAEAALDDMSVAMSDDSAFALARDFSRGLNDVFTRSFVGAARRTGGQGERSLPPELLARRAFGAGGEGAALRFREIEEAGKFLVEAGGPDIVPGIVGAQERLLRLAASRSIDPTTGRVNPNALARFVSQNDEILTRFPDVRSDLVDAKRAETVLRKRLALNEGAAKAINREAAFAKIADTENPVRAISSAVEGTSPTRELTRFSRLAHRDGPGAVSGYRTAILDYAYNKARNSGDFFTVYSDTLNKPMTRNGPSLLAFMRREGLIDAQTSARLQRIVSEGRKIETAIKSGQGLDELVENPSAMFDLVVRLVGANIGGASAVGNVAGAPIVAAAAGSRFARTIAEKVPATRLKDVLQEAARDPAFMATMLRKGKTPKQRLSIDRQMNAFLLQAGIDTVVEDDEAP